MSAISEPIVSGLDEYGTKRSNYLHAVYGAGLNLKMMRMRCPYAELVGVGELKDSELQFRGAPNSGRLTIAFKSGSAVPVAVWKVPADGEKKFLEVTGNTTWKRKPFEIELDNGYRIQANCYLEDCDYPYGLPTKSYYWDVYQGYLDHGFDVDILSDALKNSTQNYYAKARGSRIEQIEAYQSHEEKCQENAEIKVGW